MTTTPPGWYADPAPPPGQPPALRWWDGQDWTQHLAPTPGPTSSRATTTDDGEELAGWGRRLAAYAIDGVVTITATMLLGLPWLLDLVAYLGEVVDEAYRAGLAGETTSTPSNLEMIRDEPVAFGGLVVLSLVVFTVYHAVFLRLRGATPGKQLLGLRVRPVAAPGRLTLGTIARRLTIPVVATPFTWLPLVGLLVSLGVLVEMLWPLWDRRRQALHDKLAGTQVVRVRR